MERDHSSVKIFFISFLVSLLILVLIVGAVMAALFDRPQISAEQESTAPAEPAALPYQPDSRAGLNLLVISVRERSDAPHAFTLCRFDPAGERILLVPVPPETVTTVRAKTSTFAAHYDYAGSENVRMAAESLLLCEVGRYVRMGKAGACTMIDAMGGLTHRFEAEYQTEQVSVPAGTHQLNGELLYEIALSPPVTEQPDSWRLGLFGEFLLQRLTGEADDRLDGWMELFWDAADTNINRFDYTTRRKALTYFLRNEEKRVEIFPLSGSWNREHTEFVPDEAVLSELRSIFAPAG